MLDITEALVMESVPPENRYELRETLYEDPEVRAERERVQEVISEFKLRQSAVAMRG